ncbi:MAG: 50S ribosomal protein L19e [Candidatus Hadarchaeum sp.]|uniref:50S ribosomal protein L19e n=1 Tax=Candidatus Hadarchaeum sp. TaxID=2883567 RepID=UPI00316CC475
MKLDMKKRLAADILKVGVNRVWIDPSRIADVSAAITRDDIKRLIKQGAIRAKPETGISRGRLRTRRLKRRAGRRRGMGSRKGASGARAPRKANWVKTVRPLRVRLRELRKEGLIDHGEYRKLYRMVKGGYFRSKAHLNLYLKERGILK